MGKTPREIHNAMVDGREWPTGPCPVCSGAGVLPMPNASTKHTKRRIDISIMAKLLREAGYSIREIGAFLGYSSPKSVQLLLKKHGLK